MNNQQAVAKQKTPLDLLEEALEKAHNNKAYSMRESTAYYLAFQNIKMVHNSPKADKDILEKFGNFILERYAEKLGETFKVEDDDFKAFEELGSIKEPNTTKNELSNNKK